MIIVRRATLEDSNDIWLWRNDPVSRAMFINQNPVPWDCHHSWVTNALADSTRILLIAESQKKGEKIGVCRFDITTPGQTAEVAINLNPAFRGQGLAPTILTQAIDYFIKISGLHDLRAVIKAENIASIRSFKKAGFQQNSQPNGSALVELLRQKYDAALPYLVDP